MHAVVTDQAGNVFTSLPVTVTVDNTLPTASITAPSGGAFIGGSLNAVTATASGTGSGVASVVFERSNGVGWTAIGTSADTSSPYSVNWNTGALNGSFNVHAIVTDQAGNVFTTPDVAVTVDNTLPTSSMTAPSAGAFLRGSSNTVTATASGTGSGVASVVFERSNGAGGRRSGRRRTRARRTRSTGTTGLNGSFDVHAVVTDQAGNVFTSLPSRSRSTTRFRPPP